MDETDRIPGVLRRALEVNKDRLEDATRNGVDMYFHVLPVRNDTVVAVIYCKGRDHSFQALQVAGGLFRADAFIYACDTYRANRKWLDEHHRNPDPGELGELFQAGRRDLVTECLYVAHVPRDGPVSSMNADYVRTRKGIAWTTEEAYIEEGGWRVGGLVPSHIHESLRWQERLGAESPIPIPPEDLARLLSDADPVVSLGLDMTAQRALASLGYPVGLFTPSGPEFDELLEDQRRRAQEDQLLVRVTHHHEDEETVVEYEPDIDRKGFFAQLGEVVRPGLERQRELMHQQDVRAALSNRAQRRAANKRR